jgi:hypothetical protein
MLLEVTPFNSAQNNQAITEHAEECRSASLPLF